VAIDSVAESGMIDVCAEIITLPTNGLQTDLVVNLITSNSDGKAGL